LEPIFLTYLIVIVKSYEWRKLLFLEIVQFSLVSKILIVIFMYFFLEKNVIIILTKKFNNYHIK